MHEVLIIRSASMQQLDLSLPAIHEYFKDYRLGILTHEHSLKLVEKYTDITEIYIYRHKTGFRFGKNVPEFRQKRFAAAVVPVANITGVGYLNVLLFALSLPAEKLYLCNIVSEINEIKKSSVLATLLSNAAFKILSVSLTLPAMAILLMIALFGLLRRR